MKGKRILICCNRILNIGGIEKALTTFLKAFDTKNNDILLVLHDSKGPLHAELPLENIQVFYTNQICTSEYLKEDIKHFRLIAMLKGIWNRVMIRLDPFWYAKIMYTYRMIKRGLIFDGHFDCAISFTTDYSDLSMALSVDADKRICFVHGDATKNRRAARLNDRLVRKMDKIYCVSEQAKELFLEAHPKCEKTMDVLPNVLLAEDIIKKASEPAEGMLSDGTLTFCTVGRLSEEKGQQLIPQIAQILKNEGRVFRWYLVGDGTLRPELEHQISAHDLQEQVILLGSKSNPYPYMNNCDIYVQPSFSEALCTTTMEAKILCKPIVTTDAPGMREQFTSKENGLIVDAMTAESLADGIRIILEDTEMTNRIISRLQSNRTSDSSPLKKLYDYILND